MDRLRSAVPWQRLRRQKAAASRRTPKAILPIVERSSRTATIVSVAKKATTIFACIECGNQATKWKGRCPECNAWNSYAEEESGAGPAARTTSTTSVGITDIDQDEAPRMSTSIPALDRVLGGGLVFGAVTLVG